jgi:hypothetical protein
MFLFIPPAFRNPTKDTKTMKKFGDNTQAYPAEMRTQLWPLCCGAKIISGFKSVGNKTSEQLVKEINEVCDEYVADHQVYVGETMIPRLTFLTLNEQQASSKKITDAIQEAGFKLFATARPRGALQHFYYRDLTNTFKAA